MFEHSTRVRAPLEEVWQFHSRIQGLTALTPGFMNLRVESTYGPDGDPDPDVLETGSVVNVSVHPFGVGPRQTWTSEIVARRRGDGSATFRDEMRGGFFEEWVHTHSFFADGEETIVTDRVDYCLPPGRLGARLSPLATVGLGPMFAHRHRETKAILE
jgi:ligand-binding SRPBCC domain-containing protein